MASTSHRSPILLYPIGTLNAGGAQMRSLQLLREVKRRRPEIRFIVYDYLGRGGVLEDAFRSAGVEIVKGGQAGGQTVRFWRFCKSVRPTIVHTNLGAMSGYLIFAAFMAGVKMRICHFRNSGGSFNGTADRYARRMIARSLTWLLATRVVGVCDATRSFSRVRDSQWLTIYNGIPYEALDEELRRARERSPARGRIMALGRIHPQKQFWRFVPIFEALRRIPACEGATLDIVGTGLAEYMESLRLTVASSVYAEAITVAGHSSEPVECLRAADVLLMTSGYEGLPGTVLEALSVGTPVVSEDLPGVREIDSYVKGITIMPSGSTDADWAQAIAHILGRDEREAIIRSFRDSPFLLDRYVRDVMRLWGLE